MDTSFKAREWAESEFGDADLGDVRNTTRLICVAERAARHPHPKVAEVFDSPRELQAAYDLLENERFSAQSIVRASVRATARRAATHKRVLIPCDGASLSLRDWNDVRGTGSVGSRTEGARGVHVLDAVALTEAGTPLGLAAMVSWVRSLKRATRRSCLRPVAEREVRYWLDARASIREAFRELAPNTQRVFLHDSGADAWPVLLDVMSQAPLDEITVVRAGQNRSARTDASGPSYLWPLLRRAKDRWRIRLHIPPGHGRTARRALLEISVLKVELNVRKMPSHERVPVPLWAVYVRERGRVPRGQERLEWLLLTNSPTPTLKRAREVMGWYLLRWRVEDHHKTWKRSGSDVEQIQLRSFGAIEKWMAIHAAVSARALALTHQARTPEAEQMPAREAFSQAELTALRALRTAREMETPTKLSVAQAVLFVAILGGYMPARGRPPGPKILRRGLERLAVAATAVEVLGLAKPARKPTRR